MAKKDGIDVDKLMTELGAFGKFQRLNFAWLCLPIFFIGISSLTFVFTAGAPPYRCFVPGCDNATDPEYSIPWAANAIPTITKDSTNISDECLIYARKDNTKNDTCLAVDFSNKTTLCDHWVYDKSETTIATEWDLTCDKRWMLSMVGTINFMSFFFSTLIVGNFSDRLGRKTMFMVIVIILCIAGLGQALATSYIMYLCFIFLGGFGTSGMYLVAYVLAIEMVGTDKRAFCTAVMAYVYAVGEVVLGVIMWNVKEWRTRHLFVGLPFLLFLTYYWILVESIRWLISKGEDNKAQTVVEKIAKVNNKSVPNYFQKRSDEVLSKRKSKENLLGILLIFKHRRLLLRTLNMILNWTVNSFVYYGLSMNSTVIGGNKYLNFILICLVEIPSYTFAWWVMNKYGRRVALSSSLFASGICCLAAAFVPSDTTWAVITLFILGKFGITSSFNVIYIFTSELFPTFMRTSAVGTCSMCGRFGSMLAPFITVLSAHMESLPMILFGGVSLVAAFLSLLFPETLHQSLPDTIEDAENLGRPRDEEESHEQQEMSLLPASESVK